MKTENDIGTLFILAAPSGGGKSSLTKALCTSLENISVAISHTTRERRDGEEHGKHYHFVTPTEFQSMIEQDAFIEHASVFGHFYGTSKAELDKRLLAGCDVVLDIDWQGARQIIDIFPDTASIFILPPSLDSLKERLCQRARDNESVIEDRMNKAVTELSHYDEFDYLVVNDDFDLALSDLLNIVRAKRLSQHRQSRKYRHLLSNLLKSK